MMSYMLFRSEKGLSLLDGIKGKGRKSPKLCPKSCRRFPFDQDRRTFSESVVLKEEEEEAVVKLSSFKI